MSLQTGTGVPQYLNKKSGVNLVMVVTTFIQKVQGLTMVMASLRLSQDVNVARS